MLTYHLPLRVLLLPEVSPIQDTIDYHLIQNSVERKLKLEINKRLNLRTLHLNDQINQSHHQQSFP